MKKLFLLLVFIGCGVFAQPLEKSLLWKISGNGLKAPSYLFGTIHISCDATLPEKVKSALGETKQIYLELDMDDPGLQVAMMQGVMLPDGETIKKYLKPDEIPVVDNFLKENVGMGLDMLNTMKPVMLSMMLSVKQLDCPIKSLEEELMKAGKEQGENIGGLETVDDQMKALDAVPVAEQVAELLKSAKDNMASDKDEIRNLLAVYKSSDIELMLKLSRESENVTTSKYGDDLLVKRNATWIPRISAIAKEMPTFFGVGAAHLAGETGVIRLLRKEGFRVEAVLN